MTIVLIKRAEEDLRDRGRKAKDKNDTKTKGNEYKPVTHIRDIKPTTSIIILSVNGLNTLNKRQRLLE